MFDHRTDRPVDMPVQSGPRDAVLLFDGIFLMRPELDDAWDYRILVEVSPETSLRRGRERDRDELGSSVEGEYRDRYAPAQQRYIDSVGPAVRADLRIRNDDPDFPVLRHVPRPVSR